MITLVSTITQDTVLNSTGDACSPIVEQIETRLAHGTNFLGDAHGTVRNGAI